MGVCPCSVRDRRDGAARGSTAGTAYLRSSKTPQILSECPVVADYHRLSVGNAHVSCRWKGRFRWSRACRPWSVNPSRKLRRFESFTCHHVPERASDLRKRGSEAFFVYLVGVSKRRCFGDLHCLGSQACDLRKRMKPDRGALGPPGIRREVRVHT